MNKDLLHKRPPDFETVFLVEGWRGIERVFGARSTVNVRWLEECGGIAAMQAKRMAHRRHLTTLHDGGKTRHAGPACSDQN